MLLSRCNNISLRSFFLCMSIIGVMTSVYSKENCFTCHTGEAYSSTYDSTAHGLKKIACADCHIRQDNGFFTIIREKFLKTILFSFKNAHPAARPATQTCLSCHRAINKLNVIAEDALPDSIKTIGMVITHDKHFERRDSCNTCHTTGAYVKNEILALVSHDDPSGCVSCHHNLTHKKPSKYEIYYPLETGCAHCHIAKNKCPGLKNISDIKDSDRCTECHPNQYSF